MIADKANDFAGYDDVVWVADRVSTSRRVELLTACSCSWLSSPREAFVLRIVEQLELSASLGGETRVGLGADAQLPANARQRRDIDVAEQPVVEHDQVTVNLLKATK